MARSSESQGLDCAGIAAQACAAQHPIPSGGLRRRAAGAVTRALAVVDAAVAGLLYWHDVSRRIEYLLTLDDAGLRRRGLERNEIVPAVFQAARQRWARRRE